MFWLHIIRVDEFAVIGIAPTNNRRHTQPHTHAISILAFCNLGSRIPQQHIRVSCGTQHHTFHVGVSAHVTRHFVVGFAAPHGAFHKGICVETCIERFGKAVLGHFQRLMQLLVLLRSGVFVCLVDRRVPTRLVADALGQCFRILLEVCFVQCVKLTQPLFVLLQCRQICVL